VHAGTNLGAVTYTTAQGRQQLLDSVAASAEEVGFALGALGEAYEVVDEQTGERLEEGLFRPVQLAYGRLKRTHASFADRYALPARAFGEPTLGAPKGGVKGFIENAMDAVARADGTLATLQDSMLPVEVGDEEVRAEIAGVRELLGGVRGRARELMRTLGR
jgi:hypothetical protein